MARSPNWQPLFTPAEAVPFRAAVAEIAAALAAWCPTPFRPGMNWRFVPARQASLAGGAAGIALFHGYLQSAERDRGGAQVASGVAVEERPRELLERALEIVAETAVPAGFYGGFTGVAWAVQHLAGIVPALAPEEDLVAEADAALLQLLEADLRHEDYDLVSGLVGFGAYALERLPGAMATRCLERVVARLDQHAEWSALGCTWRTPPEHMTAQQRLEAPSGWYNLGLAHGIPGVIALLGAAHSVGVFPDRTLALLEGATRWLRAQRLPSSETSFYPNGTFPHGGTPVGSRLAWCFGDLGIAAALDVAARCTGRHDVAEDALALALHAAAVPDAVSRIVDAGLCHGAAGAAHIFNRLWQSTGEKRLADAARHWFERAIGMRRPGHGVAGFLSYQPEEGAASPWYPDPGVLVGAAGVGLAFLAATDSLAPEWDRLLMVSAPPAGSAIPDLTSPAVSHPRSSPR